MRRYGFSRVLMFITSFAFLAVIYVHQEVEIFKTSFAINKNRQELSFLLDQYRSLIYNLSRLESPDRIEKELSSKEIVLCMPNIDNVRRFEVVNADYKESGLTEAKKSFLVRALDRFTITAEAKVTK
jgi:hypothetical protein